VPGNDDAGRAISLYCDLIARRRSTAFRARRATPGSISAPPKLRWPKKSRDVPVSGFQPLAGPRGVADDLKKLPHVSPTVEKKLNDLGVFHYSQLAELGLEDAAKIGEEVGLADPRGKLDRQVERAHRRVSSVMMAGAFPAIHVVLI